MYFYSTWILMRWKRQRNMTEDFWPTPEPSSEFSQKKYFHQFYVPKISSINWIVFDLLDNNDIRYHSRSTQ